jgi:multiple sugar transport system ATP-binding protein
MAGVVLENVIKRYGEVTAVDNVSLTIQDGEFISLVGPSGCGKTTTLNMIAGLLDLTDGEIYIGDRPVAGLDPKDRDIAMVFQNYALYPNKTVYKNLAFPLEMRKMASAEIDQRVKSTAETLSISALLERKPRELSGGQQQRVALGRALVRSPKVFLMDEPLSNLDAKLRVQMRAELKRFHHELNATVIYVTHDQMEAMTMSDRIVVMSGGVLQQAGTPDDLYSRPVNQFVAGFIGSPSMNFLTGRVERRGDTALLVGDGGAGREGGWEYALSPEQGARALTSTGEVILGMRHNSVQLHQTERPNTIRARVYTVEPTGDVTFVHFRIGEHILVASADSNFRISADAPIWVDFDQRYIHLFDGQSKTTLAADNAPVAVAGAR